jgi:hypothetical protein
MSMKHPGRCTPCARVSLSPSKIPYDGFSPVRLQMGRRARPSSSHDLYVPQATAFDSVALASNSANRRPMALPPRGPSLGSRLCCPAPSNGTMASSAPLATSCRFMILDDRSLPRGQPREGPHFIPRVCVGVPPSVPRWTGRVHSAVASPLVQAFTISVLARHPPLRARRFPRGCVSRLQSSPNATARRLARPSPTRTFTLELSPPESPPKDVEYDYAG